MAFASESAEATRNLRKEESFKSGRRGSEAITSAIICGKLSSQHSVSSSFRELRRRERLRRQPFHLNKNKSECDNLLHFLVILINLLSVATLLMTA